MVLHCPPQSQVIASLHSWFTVSGTAILGSVCLSSLVIYVSQCNSSFCFDCVYRLLVFLSSVCYFLVFISCFSVLVLLFSYFIYSSFYSFIFFTSFLIHALGVLYVHGNLLIRDVCPHSLPLQNAAVELQRRESQILPPVKSYLLLLAQTSYQNGYIEQQILQLGIEFF